MKQTFLIQQNHPHLLLFFTGWGMDAHPFETCTPKGCDWLICYDYRSLDFDAEMLQTYTSISVIAWSMGVWVAGHVLSKHSELPVVSSLALNGTPYPIDEQRGIAPLIFDGTLQGLNERSLQKFNRRMCGSAGYPGFLERAPQRSLAELKEELASIQQHYLTSGPTRYAWKKAIVGTQDLIFPADHQRTAWNEQHTPVHEVEAAHFQVALFEEVLSGNKSME